MKRNSLLFFESPKDLELFIKSLNIYNGWKLTNGLMNERGRCIADKKYTKELKKLFAEKAFFRKMVSLAEIVSWLDNLTLIQRLFENLKQELDTNTFNSFSISVEYMIEMSKKMRVDYLIIFKTNILILEMRTVSSFNKIRPTWENKFNELLIYKELMSYYIKDKELKVFALIPMFEYEGQNKVPKNINYNANQIAFLAEYILKYIVY